LAEESGGVVCLRGRKRCLVFDKKGELSFLGLIRKEVSFLGSIRKEVSFLGSKRKEVSFLGSRRNEGVISLFEKKGVHLCA
jgi:hypothetical protein